MDLPIKNCRKCHILQSKNGSLLCEAKVIFTQSNEIKLAFRGWKPTLKSTYKLPVVFYDSVNGLVTCSCTLCEIQPVEESSGYFHALCKIQAVHDLMDRHEDFRLPISLTVTLTYVDPVTGTTQNTGGVTVNISAGGIYVITAMKLPVKFFRISFYADILPIIPLAKVLREEPLENGSFGYGCRFENLSPGYESLLRGYIFQMETQHKRK